MNTGKTKNKIFCAVLFILLFINTAAQNKKEAVIQYLGNMGVLITVDNNKFLIDALHKDYGPGYLQPDSGIIDNIIKNKNEFENADLLLSTHVHHDHFNEHLTADFLRNSNSHKTICTQKIYDSTKSKIIDIEKIKEQFLITDNSPGGVKEFTDKKIKITSYNLPHINQALHSRVQNSGYLVEAEGTKFFHVGDADPVLENFSIYNFAEKNIDVVFLPVWFLTFPDILANINAKQIIAVHANPNRINVYKDYIKEGQVLFSNMNQKFVYEKTK